MSLDVYLTTPGELHPVTGSGIYIRNRGSTVEITREEFNRRFPDKEPVTVIRDESEEVYHNNITHNLNTMAEEAGIYNFLWYPDELEITNASELITPLRIGLTALDSNPDYFRQFNPENGWGDYDVFRSFVLEYVEACEKYPYAKVSVSR